MPAETPEINSGNGKGDVNTASTLAITDTLGESTVPGLTGLPTKTTDVIFKQSPIGESSAAGDAIGSPPEGDPQPLSQEEQDWNGLVERNPVVGLLTHTPVRISVNGAVYIEKDAFYNLIVRTSAKSSRPTDIHIFVNNRLVSLGHRGVIINEVISGLQTYFSQSTSLVLLMDLEYQNSSKKSKHKFRDTTDEEKKQMVLPPVLPIEIDGATAINQVLIEFRSIRDVKETKAKSIAAKQKERLAEKLEKRERLKANKLALEAEHAAAILALHDKPKKPQPVTPHQSIVPVSHDQPVRREAHIRPTGPILPAQPKQHFSAPSSPTNPVEIPPAKPVGENEPSEPAIVYKTPVDPPPFSDDTLLKQHWDVYILKVKTKALDELLFEKLNYWTKINDLIVLPLENFAYIMVRGDAQEMKPNLVNSRMMRWIKNLNPDDVITNKGVIYLKPEGVIKMVQLLVADSIYKIRPNPASNPAYVHSTTIFQTQESDVTPVIKDQPVTQPKSGKPVKQSLSEIQRKRTEKSGIPIEEQWAELFTAYHDLTDLYPHTPKHWSMKKKPNRMNLNYLLVFLKDHKLFRGNMHDTTVLLYNNLPRKSEAVLRERGVIHLNDEGVFETIKILERYGLVGSVS